MTENNAKPLTGDETRAAIKHAHNMSGPSDATQPGEYVLAGALALLSKLRAPVADEWTPLTRQDIFDRFQFLEGLVNAHWYTKIAEAAICIYDEGRAALASSPVAGEAQKPVAWMLVGRLKNSEPKFTLADPAGIYESVYVPLYAAPQASEAVRNAVWEEAAQALEKRAAESRNEYDHHHKSPYFEGSADAYDVGAFVVRALKTQADKDGGDCAKGAGDKREPSPTAGMNLGQRIAHVGGRTNAQGYIEFGSPMAVNALIQQVLRDLPDRQQRAGDADAQLLKAARRAVLALAAASARDLAFKRDYDELSAALPAQPGKEPANPKPSAAGSAGAAGVSSDPLTGKNNDGGSVYG